MLQPLVFIALVGSIAFGILWWTRRDEKARKARWAEENQRRADARDAELEERWKSTLSLFSEWPSSGGENISTDEFLYRAYECPDGKFVLQYCRVNKSHWPEWSRLGEFTTIEEAQKAALEDRKRRTWDWDSHTKRL